MPARPRYEWAHKLHLDDGAAQRIADLVRIPRRTKQHIATELERRRT
jgi:hypothetical protein